MRRRMGQGSKTGTVGDGDSVGGRGGGGSTVADESREADSDNEAVLNFDGEEATLDYDP